VEPKRPPRILVPLVDCELEEQMPVVFTTTIDAGSPMATVSRSPGISVYEVIARDLLVHMVQKWQTVARRKPIRHHLQHCAQDIDTADLELAT
jgi:hypothetical protein